MIELIDIYFERDNKIILNNINLKLEKNKFYSLTGPNGSGKSTLAKVIMGLTIPDKGKILFNGEDITNKSIDERAKLGIGFAFQTSVCFKGITVYDLLSVASNKSLTKKEACDILSKVGLCALEYIDREVNKSLSGGELKRIEIASVIARNPKFAIFDEPEAGIDLWSFNSLNKVFKNIQENNDATTLVISHQEKILDIADEIILMENGTIKKVGSKEEVISNINSKPCCKVGDMNE